jgi:acetyltransferase-like isoleucine patch superfamily enzyme
MRVGSKTRLPKMMVTWPHQISIGNNCRMEDGIFIKFDGIWKPGPSICFGNHVFIGSGTEFNIRIGLSVGNDTLIASGCRFVDHDHGISLGALMRKQEGPESPIKIGSDVWLGCNVVVLKGVTIGDGAIVAAGAVITKSIGENEIWAGVPARKIGNRGES